MRLGAGFNFGFGRSGGNRNLVSASGVAAGLYLDTRANSAFVSGLPSDLASILNVVRATTAMDEYADGSIASVATNVARYGGGQGLMIERAATNIVRNSTNVGTAAGSPGTNPTTWTANLNSNVGTIAIQITGFGTTNGIPYTEFRVAGTGTGAGFFQAVFAPGGAADVAVATGDVLTSSAYLHVVGGSMTGITSPVIAINENTAVGAFVTNGSVAAVPTTTMQRLSYTRTLSGGGTVARAASSFAFSYSTTPIDVTFRIGGVQLETGPKATAFIPTSTVAVTRNADQIKITGAPLTAGIGVGTAFTIFAEYQAYVSADASYLVGFGNDAAPSINEAIYTTVSTSRTGAASVVSASSNTFTNAAAALNVPTTLNRLAMRVAANDAAISHNGAAVIPDITITMPASLDRITLGSSPGSIGTQALNGRLTRFAAFPSLLPDADLQAAFT